MVHLFYKYIKENINFFIKYYTQNNEFYINNDLYLETNNISSEIFKFIILDNHIKNNYQYTEVLIQTSDNYYINYECYKSKVPHIWYLIEYKLYHKYHYLCFNLNFSSYISIVDSKLNLLNYTNLFSFSIEKNSSIIYFEGSSSNFEDFLINYYVSKKIKKDIRLLKYEDYKKCIHLINVKDTINNKFKYYYIYYLSQMNQIINRSLQKIEKYDIYINNGLFNHIKYKKQKVNNNLIIISRFKMKFNQSVNFEYVRYDERRITKRGL